MTEEEFKKIYVSWYSRFKIFAMHYVLYESDAENIVQDVFMELYEKKDLLVRPVNVVSYLFTCVKNRCLDHLRHKTIENKVFLEMKLSQQMALRLNREALESFDASRLSTDDSDMEKILMDAIASLPEKCRKIFVMNKIEKIKQKDIAICLDISVNTVESQMSIAYKKLKESLKDYLPLLLFFLINN